jgi:acyl-CoA synthetase (AMP-forming)/AMP-acid ligase II/acyl carrier protein
MEQTISGQLKSVVQRYGDRIALTAPNYAPLSYTALLEQIVYVVDALSQRGVGRGDRVALVMTDGPSMAVAFLGLAACATCAPLNPAYRVGEFESLFSDLRPKALLVSAGIESTAVTAAENVSIPVIELFGKENAAAGFAGKSKITAPTTRHGLAKADDVALLLFTSGTTARPKLVPLTHANLIASARAIESALQLTPNDRCLNIMPLFHIHGLVGGLLASLMNGGSVVCPPGFLAAKFFDWLGEFQPTWYTAVPTMHQAILGQGKNSADIIRRNPLRFIRSSSSPLPKHVMEDLETVFQTPVIESYGMTEGAHQITSNPLPPGIRKPGSTGKAAGPDVAILDEGGNRQPEGVVGEVVIRGANVMHGYASPEGASHLAFTDGWFRTGDQGYIDGDGYLFLTARIKELINRGGLKISPREIEAVLMTHPAVEQAVAFPVAHPTLGEDVAAAIVLRPETKVVPGDLKEFVSNQLADFKVPRELIIVDEIPKSPTGKTQRGALTKKFSQQLQSQFVAPRSELESTVARIFAEVLGIERVGTADNFFALGGDSLRATQVLARIRAVFDLNLSIAAVFRNSTVTELADEIVRFRAEIIDKRA